MLLEIWREDWRIIMNKCNSDNNNNDNHIVQWLYVRHWARCLVCIIYNTLYNLETWVVLTHFTDEKTRLRKFTWLGKRITKLLEDKNKILIVFSLSLPKPCFESRERWNVSALNQRAVKWKGRVLGSDGEEGLFGALKRRAGFPSQVHYNSKAYHVSGSRPRTLPTLYCLILTTALKSYYHLHSTDKEPEAQRGSYCKV